MKRFLIKLSIVMMPFMAVLAILIRVAYVTELNLLKKDLTFPPGIRAAVLGDSRVATTFDPDEIPWLRNCGKPAIPFEITAHKAKLIAELNPNLELIIIDMWLSDFWGDPACPHGISLIEIMSREDMPPLGDNFPVRLSQGLIRPGLKHSVSTHGDVKSQIAGGFATNHEFLKENQWSKIETYTSRPKYQLKGIPPRKEVLLENLLNWMKKHNRKVVLTSTPLYDLWWNNCYSEEARAYFERRMTEIAKKHGIHWYNWMHEYQDKIDCWADGVHMNDIGAKQFSRDKRPILEAELATGR